MIYLDNAATTPVPAAVADAMYDVLTRRFGNPSSQYPIGQEMKKAVEGWRAVIAAALDLLRHRVGQLGHSVRRLAGPPHLQAHHHHRCGAQRRAGALPLAAAAGL